MTGILSTTTLGQSFSSLLFLSYVFFSLLLGGRTFFFYRTNQSHQPDTPPSSSVMFLSVSSSATAVDNKTRHIGDGREADDHLTRYNVASVSL